MQHHTMRSACALTMAILTPAALGGCKFKDDIKAQVQAQLGGIPSGSGKLASSFSISGAQVGPGRTTKENQVIDIECTVVTTTRTGDGPPVTRTVKVTLHTKPLPKGTEFKLKCDDPLILEVPDDARAFSVVAQPAGAGPSVALPVREGLTAIPISADAKPRMLAAEPHTRLVVVRTPDAMRPGDYRLTASFRLASARPVRMKAIFAADVVCGRATYVQPLLPAVTSWGEAPAVTLPVAATMTSVALPGGLKQPPPTLELGCGRP